MHSLVHLQHSIHPIHNWCAFSLRFKLFKISSNKNCYCDFLSSSGRMSGFRLNVKTSWNFSSAKMASFHIIHIEKNGILGKNQWRDFFLVKNLCSSRRNFLNQTIRNLNLLIHICSINLIASSVEQK